MTVLAVSLLAVFAAAGSAVAQEWPQRPVRLVVGFAAGGGTDVIARIVAQSLQERLGQAVVVENRPGAGGTVAAEAVARADKDGHTLGMLVNGQVIAAVLNRALRYDTLTAFAPVGQVATAGLAIVARKEFPADDVKQLLDRAKAEPGKITFASVGFGGTQHFVGELFKQVARVDILHVPYRASPEAISALLGRQVDLIFDTVPAVLGQIQSGDLKALAVTGAERLSSLPNVPTVAESGLLPGFAVSTWYAVVAPAGTPAAVVAKLNATLDETLRDAGVRERLSKVGVTPHATSPAALGAFMAEEYARWNGVREAAGIPQQ